MFAGVELGENMRGGAAELQSRLRRDRLHICDTPHAVCSKNLLFLRHVGY
jgi:hypothetical protein